MSRPLRLEFPGAIWHVTSRGNARHSIFRDNLDRKYFLRRLADVVRDRGWILHAWVLMSNHYHLLLETPEVGLSRGVKWLNQQYADYFNERHHRVGHLFQGRFHAVLVERETHLLELTRYIVLNPVRCGAVASAGEYEWSNYGATAGLRPAPPWLEVQWTLAHFGPELEIARYEYRRYVGDRAAALYNPWKTIVGQLYLGGAEFGERLQQMVGAEHRSREHPYAQRQFGRPSLQRVVALVCEAFDITEAQLQRKSRGPARKALAQLAIEQAGLTARSVGEWLQVSDWAASKMRQAARVLYTSDASFREAVDGIRARL